MDIWMRVCRKRAKCRYCPEYIEKGQFMVVGKLWRTWEGQPRRWVIKLHWHPQCWIQQAVDKLSKEPKLETRGRKKSELTQESQIARVKILRRHAAVVQRIRVEMVKGEDQNIERIIHLGNNINKLKEEIEPLGGVPKNWR